MEQFKNDSGEERTHSIQNQLIRVGIADDYPVVLRGVESLLTTHKDIVVVFASESIAQLMGQLEQSPVDVLLCDYAFDDAPQADGLNLLRKIRHNAPATRVIFFSSHAMPHIISSTLEQGASGFISKSKSDFVNLPQAIRNVHAGNVYLPPSLSSLLLANMYGRSNKLNSLNSLSERELVVTRMICEGMSIADISERLFRSPKTISNQKLSAMKKLGAANDVDLSRIFRDLTD